MADNRNMLKLTAMTQGGAALGIVADTPHHANGVGGV